jgi:predicted metal-dependent hydrolase
MKDRTEEIILDSIDPCLKIACLIRKSNRARRINLRIRSKEKVVLTLPRWTSLREGYSFLNQQKKWLDKNVRKFPSICSLVQYFSNGGRVWLSDNFHLLTCLKMSDQIKVFHEISNEEIKLYFPADKIPEEIIFSFLRALAKKI